MEVYISLLRGINVSGQKIIKMAKLRELLERLGFSEVNTYIQSGNVVFMTKATAENILQKKIKDAIKADFGFDVPVLVMKRTYLKTVVDNNPFANKLKEGIFEDKKMYYTLLSEVPDITDLDMPDINPAAGEAYVIDPQNKVVYVYAGQGYGKTKLTNNLFEKKLKCSATTRNLRTLNKLLDLSLIRQ